MARRCCDEEEVYLLLCCALGLVLGRIASLFSLTRWAVAKLCAWLCGMWRNLFAAMQTVGSSTARFNMQTHLPSPLNVTRVQPVLKTNRAASSRLAQRHITTMSYPQAYHEPAPARSNRVYTNFAVSRRLSDLRCTSLICMLVHMPLAGVPGHRQVRVCYVTPKGVL